MRRLFWVALGATAGVLLMRKVTKVAEALTPQSMADQLAGSITTLGEAIRDFTLEVRAGMAEREAELNSALGLSADPENPTRPGGPL